MRTLIPIFLLLFTGCTGAGNDTSPKVEADADADMDADTDTDGDSDTADGTAPSIADFIHDPASVGGSWYYEVDIDGWADAVVLDITENSDNPWSESHHLDEVSFTKDPYTDTFAKEIPVVGNWDEQKNEVNTLFSTTSEPHMVWMFTAYVQSEAAACGVAASDGNVGDFAGYGCVNFSR
jgi:hypothetical protein